MALPVLAAVLCTACDQDETEDGVGEQLAFSATPGVLHLVVANPATSTLSFTLTDLKDVVMPGETIELAVTTTSGTPGMLSAPSVVTDLMGQATATFTSTAETMATVIATHNLLIGGRSISVFDEDLDSVTAPTTGTLASCTGTVTLLGVAFDTQSPGLAMTGVNVTATVTASDMNGTNPSLQVVFTPVPTPTDNAGVYSLTFDPVDADCDANCLGAVQVCTWTVQVTATAPGSGTIVPSTTITTISETF